jgi:peptide/nickel transport system permease protein
MLWLLKRLAGAVVVVLITIVITSAIVAVMLPDAAPGNGVWDSTVTGVRLMVLHRDFGMAGVVPGAVSVTTLFDRGVALDLVLLVGGIVAGVLLGVAGGRLCAMWPRSIFAGGLEAFAMLMLSVPIYCAALVLLLLFEPSFGSLLHIPVVFQPGAYKGPGHGVGHWLESMIVPWILVGVPIAAVALRLTAAQTTQNLTEPYVATAAAKGLPRRRVVGHAARPTYVLTAAVIGTQVRLLVFNIMFVEYLFFLPGFFLYTKRAIGQDPPLWLSPDVPTLVGISVWSAVLVAVLSLLSDLAIVLLDPRIELRTES